MRLWFLALKARKAGNWPRTFYTGLTVADTRCFYWKFLDQQFKEGLFKLLKAHFMHIEVRNSLLQLNWLY